MARDPLYREDDTLVCTCGLLREHVNILGFFSTHFHDCYFSLMITSSIDMTATQLHRDVRDTRTCTNRSYSDATETTGGNEALSL